MLCSPPPVCGSCGDWLLLGRKASWIDGRYSCLAGFAELGETLEQAVAREVAEEAGEALRRQWHFRLRACYAR